MAEVRKLDVFREDELVGVLNDETPLRFIYAEPVLRQGKEPISPAFGLGQAEYAGEVVEAFFENLLPEAGIRELLKLKYQVSSTFGLLMAIGGDTAGNLTLLPHGKLPEAPQYEKISWEEIAESFRDPNKILPSGKTEDGIRISLAGAQKKISILVRPDGPYQPLDSSPSTYILKPDIKGIDGVWSSAINETFVMKLASSLKLGVAEVEYQPIVRACLVKRYDRITNNDGSIKRLNQLDLCQLDGKLSTVKYEADGGPSLARCCQLLRDNGVPASDMKRLVQWVFFNLFVGNNDSHAKNLSIYFLPGEGVKLTPFYDLLSTSMYPGLSRKFAFKIGGENLPAEIRSNQVMEMAKELNFKPTYVMKIAEKIADDILINIDDITAKLMLVANVGSDRTLLERLNAHIKSNTVKFQKRIS